MTYRPGGAAALADGAVTMTKLASEVTTAINAKAPASTAVVTTDPRLSDARTPTAHVHAYASLTGLPTLGTAAASATTDFTPASFTPTASACPATTGAMTVTMGQGVRTITPTGACTFNASGGVAGQVCTFAITTAGSSSFTLTWGTNFRKTGTLATGATGARFFSVTFVCTNGTIWQEVARTAAQT